MATRAATASSVGAGKPKGPGRCGLARTGTVDFSIADTGVAGVTSTLPCADRTRLGVGDGASGIDARCNVSFRRTTIESDGWSALDACLLLTPWPNDDGASSTERSSAISWTTASTASMAVVARTFMRWATSSRRFGGAVTAGAGAAAGVWAGTAGAAAAGAAGAVDGPVDAANVAPASAPVAGCVPLGVDVEVTVCALTVTASAGAGAAGAGAVAVDVAATTTAESVSVVFGLVVEVLVCAETVVTGRSSPAVPPEVIFTVRLVSDTVVSLEGVVAPPDEPDVLTLLSPVLFVPPEPPDVVLVVLLDAAVPSSEVVMLVPEMVLLGPVLEVVSLAETLSVSAAAIPGLVQTSTSPAERRHAPAVS
ncbi:hypothetical protein D806_016170 [Mycolicibacterium smegmatis MKD8]|uniref:Uncharacterized protein n=1 Tax=Mycolicibacterium smegmatis (strain MKD8) TaxID=1214915 RepID=A0A2U9PLI2_MYCSE|nr:hypothetical protein D806_016170 [Mycolicibacterium smegmatis MKD8]